MRRPDWEQRLADYVEAHREAVFEWGRLDCCRFTAGAVKAVTGHDPMRGLRGRYSGKRSAQRLVAELGGLEAHLDTKFDRVAPAFASRGDIVMADGMLGVCLGGQGAFIGEGLRLRPRADWSAAWRV